MARLDRMAKPAARPVTAEDILLDWLYDRHRTTGQWPTPTELWDQCVVYGVKPACERPEVDKQP